MTSWPALDVAIGLSFTFAILSLVCTSANEAVASVFNLRAKTLERWLGSVLTDPGSLDRLAQRVEHVLADAELPPEVVAAVTDAVADGDAAVADVEKLVRAQLQEAGVDAQTERALAGKLLAARKRILAPTSPSARAQAAGARAVESANVDAFFDHPAVKPLVKQPKWGLAPRPPERASRKGRRPSYVPSSVFATFVLDEATGRRAGGTAGADVVSRLPEAVRGAIDVPGHAVSAADADLTALRARIEGWYDQSMERVSGWYKRRVQLILAVIAVVVAASLNVDTLQMANSFWSDTTLRGAIVANAGRAVASGPGVPTSTSLTTDLQKVHDLDLPLGWARSGGGPSRTPTSFRLWLSKVLGLAMTAFALMLGAPFWFDTLGRIVRIRGSGDKPEPSAAAAAPAPEPAASAAAPARRTHRAARPPAEGG